MFEIPDFLKWDCIERACLVDGYRVRELYDFVEVGVGDLKIVEFAFEGSDRVEHPSFVIIYEC